MQEKGLEPSLYCYNRHLKPARLPIPPFLRTVDLKTSVKLPLKIEIRYGTVYKVYVCKKRYANTET